MTETVTPEIVDDEPMALQLAVQFTPAVIVADFPTMRERLEVMLEPYKGMTPEGAANMDYKAAKACRAELNKMSKSLNDGRKSVKREYDKPLNEFEDQVKELDAMIKQYSEMLAKAIKDHDNAEKEERKKYLDGVYEEFAPVLYDVVPFEQILEPKWLNKSESLKKTEDALRDKVAGIIKDWDSLKKTTYNFPEETEAEFFRTLSLREANEYDARRTAEQARIDELNATVAENRGESPKPEPERREPVVPVEELETNILIVQGTPLQMDVIKAYLASIDVHGRLIHTTFEGIEDAAAAIRKTLGERK